MYPYTLRHDASRQIKKKQYCYDSEKGVRQQLSIVCGIPLFLINSEETPVMILTW